VSGVTGRHEAEYCPPPTDRLCGCPQCRSEWKEREFEMSAQPDPDPDRCPSCVHPYDAQCDDTCCYDNHDEEPDPR